MKTRENRITVAYAALAPFISGSERSLQQTILSVRHAIKVVLIVPKNSPLIAWAINNNIRYYIADLNYISLKSSPRLYMSNLFKLLRIFASENIDIVHSNQLWSFPAVSMPAALLGVKTVCHFRDPIDMQSNWWIRRKLDLALFISRHIESTFLKSVSDKKYRASSTLINPVHLPRSESEIDFKKNRIEAQHKLNLSTNVFTFGFIGQISPIKGVLELIEALSKLEYEWQLVIAGEASDKQQEYFDACVELVSNLNLTSKINFVGFMDDVSTFYHSVDCVVMLSKQEPLGRVPLEAASFYKPTIANAVGGLPETIRHGETGWLKEEDSVESLLYFMEEAINTNSWQIGKKARMWVEEVADPAKYGTKLVELYIRCLNL